MQIKRRNKKALNRAKQTVHLANAQSSVRGSGKPMEQMVKVGRKKKSQNGVNHNIQLQGNGGNNCGYAAVLTANVLTLFCPSATKTPDGQKGVSYMGHKSKKSLVRQVQEALQSKLSPGDSKHLDKRQNVTGEKIYSYNTFRTYEKHSCAFAKWAKAEHGCKTLADCRQYVDGYLEYRASYCSPYTVKLDAASIAKTYGESTTNFAPTPSRVRSDVTRSRGEKGMDKHFSEVKNSNLVDFCRASGLRRSEVKSCKGSSLVPCTNSPVGLGIYVASGKGGKERVAPLFCDRQTADRIASMCSDAGDGKLFAKVHGAADIHGFRGEYAAKVYQHHARPLETLQRPEKYYCRGDKAGYVYDRQALQATTKALGHNRISVAASNYLYNVK